MDRDIAIPIGIILVTTGLLIWLACYSSSYEARIYNEQFGTHYTTKDFFFASDAIRGVKVNDSK